MNRAWTAAIGFLLKKGFECRTALGPEYYESMGLLMDRRIRAAKDLVDSIATFDDVERITEI